MSEGPTSPKRVCIKQEDVENLPRGDLIMLWKEQEMYLNHLEEKRKAGAASRDEDGRESEEKLKQQHIEAARRENTLVLRLTAKEQELQDYMNQIQEMKQSQAPSTAQLRSMLLDPAINLVFSRMKKEMADCKEKLEQTQNELSAWKFTPDSQTGKRLMAKCRMLLQENEELGKVLSSGRTAKLEGEIALEKTLVQEMKNSQAELDEFLGEIDEDVEGMQSMIYVLQQQLKEAKEQLAQVQEENQELKTQSKVLVESRNSEVKQPCGSPPAAPIVNHSPSSWQMDKVVLSQSQCEPEEIRSPSEVAATENHITETGDSIDTEEEDMETDSTENPQQCVQQKQQASSPPQTIHPHDQLTTSSNHTPHPSQISPPPAEESTDLSNEAWSPDGHATPDSRGVNGEDSEAQNTRTKDDRDPDGVLRQDTGGEDMVHNGVKESLQQPDTAV